MTEPQTDVTGVEPVAIVGMACRVPGARNVAEFWRNLIEGTESIRRGTLEEHAAAGVPPDQLADPDFVPVSSVLPDPEYFDAGMFGMSSAEAELRDPQHRLFLELAHTALEDAGLDPRRYRGDIGVYAGSGEDAYQWQNVRRNRAAAARSGAVGLAVNSHPDYVATLASYHLGLRGPSLTVHTACSTSMVAVHLACEALRNGECDIALAGGVNIDLPLRRGYVYVDGGVYSRDGHCRAFDAGATGTVWGSGGAVVVLKRLHGALANGDDIRAVIIGNAINNDGATKVGFTAPSQQGQAAVITQALSVAAVDPRTIGFVEAHGTGTALGDPIEVAALTSAYRRGTEDRGWCAIGSVKTNIGHLGPASGVVGLLKATLAVRHGVIPPSLNYETPNPAIDFGENPFFVNTAASVWPDSDTAPRRAAVSSFGMGGTNAHLILEQPPRRPPRGDARPGWQVIQVSAATETALAASAAALADHLRTTAPPGDGDLADVAHTLRVGRQQLPWRLAVVAADRAEAARALRDKKRWIRGSAGKEPAYPVFLFPGQGAQHGGMGAELYATEPAYRDAVDECCSALADLGRADLRELLTRGDRDDETLRRTAVAQPALFTVEYALARLWRSWGVTPRAMIGHSIGEYVAATCAGVFTLQDALRVVAARADLMQSLPAGSMIAVQLGEDELRALLPETASIAAVNGPEACLVAGPPGVIGELASTLGQAEISARRLRTSHAFHSPMMDPVISAFRGVVAAVELRPPAIPFTSNVGGGWITEAEATDPSYWARHLRETVRFGDCIATAAGQAGRLFLECGPGRQLSGLVRMQRCGHTAIPSLPGPAEKATDRETLTAALGRLWVAGCQLDADAIAGPDRRVTLPTYPWERRYYWVKPDPEVPDAGRADRARDGAADARSAGRFAVPAWRQLAPAAAPPSVPSRILVLSGNGDLVADALAGRGSDVVRVRRGGGYRYDGSDGYQVRPASREDYEALFADLRARGGIPGHIVHCWTMDDPPADSAEAAWTAQNDGFFSALSLVQALAGAAPDSGVRLDMVTAGTQGAIGHDVARPEHSTVAGAVKVLPLEFPWLTARHIDVDSDFAARATAGDRGPLLTALLDELSAPDGPTDPADEPLVALRHGRRWRRGFTDAPEAGPPDRMVLREHGVYLITGGLGGIGITLAEDLATRFKAKLVLTSRQGLPQRRLWDAPEAAGASARVKRAIAAIGRMERAGAEVHVVAADITDPAAVHALRAEVIARFGSLNGIVHAAGVAGGGMAEIKDRDVAVEVLRPKIAGTLALRDVFAGDRLDFVVLCSSVAAIAGGFGQVDYCAANAFLDAHADGDRGWATRVVSVNWGAWQEVGMAAEVTAPAAFRALQRGQQMFPVRHGLLTERHPAEGDAPTWCAGTLSASTHWLLADHRISGVPVLPGTAHLEAARAAFEECCSPPGPGYVVELSDVVFTEPLAVPDGGSAELRVMFTPAADGMDFQVVTVADGLTRVHSRGAAAWIRADGDQVADLAAIRERCSLDEVSGDSLKLSSSGLITFGARWGNLVRVHRGAGEELALLVDKENAETWTIQPALLDEALASGWSGIRTSSLPFGYGRAVIRRPMPGCVLSHLRYRESGTADMVMADATLYDEAGRALLQIEDYTMRKVDGAAMTRALTVAAPPTVAGGLSPASGAEAFRQLVNHGTVAQIVVSATPIEAMIAASHRVDYEAVAEATPAPRAETGPPGAVPSALDSDQQRAVAEIWADLLGDEARSTSTDFFDAGGNSLIAVQLIASLRKQFGVRMPMRRFFADPTISGIAALIDELSLASADVTGEGK